MKPIRITDPDLKYANVVAATFLERLNRFVARVRIGEAEEKVHVKNTGRCREILLPGTKVYLEESSNPKRKMRYSLIAAYKGNCLINIDSQAPNAVVKRALERQKVNGFLDLQLLRREVTFGGSRFDFYYETASQKGFIEVKGVTLEREGRALFPDAPTERGTRHLRELVVATQAGYSCAVIFLIQLTGVNSFGPNEVTDPEFTRALREAAVAGVRVLAYDCRVEPDEMDLIQAIPVRLVGCRKLSWLEENSCGE